MGDGGVALTGIGVLFALIIGVLWIVLPFAVFGIKSRLEAVERVLKEIRDRLPPAS